MTILPAITSSDNSLQNMPNIYCDSFLSLTVTKKQFVAYAWLVLKYALIIAIIGVLFFARVHQDIAPFALAFLFALTFVRINFIAVALGAFAVSMFTGVGQVSNIINLIAIGAWAVYYPVFHKNRKKLKKPQIEIAVTVGVFVLATVSKVIFAIQEPEMSALYRSLISIMVGGIFLVAMIILVKTIMTRKGKIPWTHDQRICLIVFCVMFSLGLGGLENDFFSVHKFVVILVILIGVYKFEPRNTLALVVALGLGRSLGTLNLTWVAIYALLAGSVVLFKSKNIWLGVVSLIVTDLVLGTYFNAYLQFNVFTFIPTFVAIAVFLALPKRVYDFFDTAGSYLSGYLVTKNTINQNRTVIHGKLKSLSEVFFEMQNIYRGLVIGKTPPKEQGNMLSRQVIHRVCSACPLKPSCKRTQQDENIIRESVIQLLTTGLIKGGANFMDLPSSLSVKCGRVNAILSVCNQLIEETKEREIQTATLDKGKILMSNLLEGISKLCTRFAQDVGTVVYDEDRAILIKEDLLYKQIVASDCLISRVGQEYSVSILVGREMAKSRDIPLVISKALGHKMQVDTILDTGTKGFSIVTVKTAPKHSVTFGVAAVPKNHGAKNGDSYSFLKLASDKSLMAVCDGMGAGEAASRASILAISLVENFYKAGFPNEIIMESVNQLLTLTCQEVFSALDLTIFNLATGEVDFIKVGATHGFVKRAREVEVIEAGSLPLGILDEMKPKITHAILQSGDFVVLASDGIIECFANDQVALSNYINNLSPKTAQQLADEIMQESLNRAVHVPPDDCTVVVALLL